MENKRKISITSHFVDCIICSTTIYGMSIAEVYNMFIKLQYYVVYSIFQYIADSVSLPNGPCIPTI